MQKKLDDKQKSRAGIQALRERLIKTGYNPGEIDYLIHKKGHGKDLGQLSLAELNQLKQVLQAQLDIAQRCMEIV